MRVKILDRYLIKGLVMPFLGSLSFLTMMLLLDRVFDLMDLLLKRGVPGRIVLELLLLVLPSIFALTVPMGVLVAVLVNFGRLSGDFEIIAMKSLGISIKRMMMGPLFVSILVFVSMVAFNNYVLPEANHRLKNLIMDIHQMKPALDIKAGIFNVIDRYRLYFKSKNDRTSTLYDVKIQEIPEGGGLRTIIAKRAKLLSEKGLLIVKLFDGEVHEAIGEKKEEYRKLRFDQHVIRIPFNTGLNRRERAYRSDREMGVTMLLEEIKKTKKELLETHKEEKTRMEFLQRKIRKFWVEVHKKFSLPFASVVFVLFGIPIAVMTRDRGYGTAFGLSFPIFTFYYVLLVGGESLADKGLVSPWFAIWFPNILLLILGAFLIKRSES